LPNQRKSEPAASTFSSRPRMLPETANPWSGPARAPPAMRIPDPPTEKSPETGSAVWIPRNSVRRMPSPRP